MAAKIRGFESALPIALLRARAASAHKFKPYTDAEGLSQPQWRVMRALAPGEPLETHVIARRCALLAPSVSRIVRALSDRDLIAEVETDDRRRRCFAMTEAGMELFDRVALVSEAIYLDIERAYGREELIRLIGMLDRLTETCGDLPDLPLPETLDSLKETSE